MPSITRRIRLTSWSDLCGVYRYIFTNFSFPLICKRDSQRVPRVGRMWLAQAHAQALHRAPSTRCVPNGQVGLRLSPKPIALAYLQRAQFIQTCVMWVFTCLLSRYITRAFGVNFPQTKPRALNTARTPPNQLQKSSNIRLCGALSNMQLGMST
jgi:hypothetical protein